MINRIFNTVRFITNNPLQGNVTPFEFNLALHNRMLEIYEEYFVELNRFLNRENRGLITNHGFAGISEKMKEKIAYFLTREDIDVDVDSTEPEFPIATIDLPENHRYTDYVVNKKNRRPFDLALSRSHFDTLERFKHTRPTSIYPVYFPEGRTLLILPTSLEKVTVHYLRNPKKPNWTFNDISGTEMYNPADPAFQDVDMHPSEENELTIRVLKSFGVNLKENELVEIANSEEMQDFQKDNTL
tara:strand:+ start:772 stop:1500 length:729 start_codon:yes stop_codon:yes gene_type:complete